MVSKIKFIADLQSSIYERGTFDEFKAWISPLRSIQFDIETNVPDQEGEEKKRNSWNEFKIISMQFGTTGFSDRTQWFLQWSELDEEQRLFIKGILEDKLVEKLAHNAKFEYIVCRFHGIICEHFYDTMLAEKILNGGIENANYKLADIAWKYLRIIMDKSLQKSFGDNIITDDKIEYGITDVIHLDVIKRQQILEGAKENLLNVFALEMETLPGLADITYNGQHLDQEKWRQNIALAEPVIQAAFDKVNAWLVKEPFLSYAISQGHISNIDRCTVNYNSPPQKKELLQLMVPDIISSSQPIIKKYLKDNNGKMHLEYQEMLVAILDGDYSIMENLLIRDHRRYLINRGYLIPAGQTTINWNSDRQVLPVVQLVIPKIKGLSEKERNKFSHPILKDIASYWEALKLTTTFGEEYIRKYVDKDGQIRPNINQVVSTGRISMSGPNMQQLIVKESVGTRYRNAFTCGEDEDYIDSDYVSQELVILAHLSQEPVWLEALDKGQDLHSVCSEIIYGVKWKKAAAEDCAYYKMEVNKYGILEMAKKKCKCKEHKTLRDDVKTLDFGLAYGMSEFKLAGELGIPVPEAKKLMEVFFAKFPRIKELLDFLGRYGVEQGHILTLAPFWRKRWFPFWYENRAYIPYHLSGSQYNGTLGEIERASKNHPIQGSSGDMTKTAIWLMRTWLQDNGLYDKVRIVAQVHDQVTSISKKTVTNIWLPKMDELMCQAAKLIIPTGALKADTQNTGSCWSK